MSACMAGGGEGGRASVMARGITKASGRRSAAGILSANINKIAS